MADDGAIAAVARRELGAAPDRVERLPDGDRHETYALDCGGGAYVLQFVADVAGRADDPARGLGLYRLLSDSGVPVPALVTDRPREFDGRTYTVVERLPGRSAETDVSPARARAAGRGLARIHDALAFDRPGWIGFERDDDGPAPVVRPFEAGGFAARVDRGIGRSVATR
jgi:Ser/Thr protein kinase RdoA (MazF antagonist)